MFARWGRFVYRFRWATLIASALLLGLSIVALLTGANLTNSGNFGSNLAAGQASQLINEEIHPQGAPGGSSFTLIFSSGALAATGSSLWSVLQDAVASLDFDSRVTAVRTPYNVPPIEQSAFISRDSHKALVIVELKDGQIKAETYIDQVTSEIHPSSLTYVLTGGVPISMSFSSTLQDDLQRAEYVALPVTLLLLILIFAAVVAALLPLGVGLLAIVGGLGGPVFLAHFTDVSQYASNVVTLIGLGVAIDYSLFIVNRFRDELAAGHTREDAIAISMSTPGRATTFSGATSPT